MYENPVAGWCAPRAANDLESGPQSIEWGQDSVNETRHALRCRHPDR